MLGGGEGSSPSVSATHNLFFDRSLFKTLLMADLCIIEKKRGDEGKLHKIITVIN